MRVRPTPPLPILLVAPLWLIACTDDGGVAADAWPDDRSDESAECVPPESSTYRLRRDPLSDEPFHWQQPVCIDIAVADSGCKELTLTQLLGAVDDATALWVEPSCAELCFEPTDTAAATTFGYDPDAGSNQTLLYWVSDEAEWLARHSEAAVAITTIITEVGTGRILDADIELNDFGAHHWTLDTEAVSADVVSIVAHELGHVLGLAHATDADSLMSTPWEPGWLHRELSAGDRHGICYLYGCE